MLHYIHPVVVNFIFADGLMADMFITVTILV